jgi:hypothetical protein
LFPKTQPLPKRKNFFRNTLETCRTVWELDGNALGTFKNQKIQPPPQKKKLLLEYIGNLQNCGSVWELHGNAFGTLENQKIQPPSPKEIFLSLLDVGYITFLQLLVAIFNLGYLMAWKYN